MAPLRLYLTVKYGYKSLKCVGLIRFQDERPRTTGPSGNTTGMPGSKITYSEKHDEH